MKRQIRAGVFRAVCAAALTVGFALPGSTASAQQTPMIGQLMPFTGTFCPSGWATASGQLLPISSYTALFSIVGTIYGGDGRTTFALPDLRSRTPVAYGQGPGLQNLAIGQFAGTEQTTLTEAQMPAHSHNVNATNALGNKLGPGTDYLADPPPINGTEVYLYHDGPPNKQMDPGMISSAGLGQPFPKRPPYQTIRWCIALQGIYPSRS